MSTATLERTILSFPTLLSLATTDANSPARAWIQLARTGSFVSNRYGKFAITRDDLAQMARNFTEVTPTPPTQLPIDFDHLSMDPKNPGDGKAAGWLQRVELRGDGDELWGEVEWTPEAAELIKNRAYRFVSPSFVRDHTHKDGRKIGTTLLAAAITNHPFLEGMQALTLYSFSAMGDLGMADPPTTPVHVAEVGQTSNTTAEGTTMDTKTTEQKAAAFAARVAELSKSCALRDAISLATTQDAEGAEAYRLAGIGAEQVEAAPMPASINLSVREGETFDALAMRYAHEHGVSLRQAVHVVGKARPDLVRARR